MLPAVLFPIPTLTVTAVIDILAVAFVIYQLLEIVRGTRAAHILVGILAVVITYEIALRTGLEALRSLLASLAPYTAIAIIVLFQSEIRRTLARLGRKRLFGGYRSPESTAEILLALGSLSRERTGALIVLERDIGLRTFIESGVRLDSHISRDLLLSIFLPGTALHDGAIIVQKDRISAAACFLPLSVNPAFSTKTGTRHRAGIGITEETDCLSIIVSEETGLISVAAFGDIESGLTIQEVDDHIHLHFGAQRKVTQASRPSPPSGPPAAPSAAPSARQDDSAVESARQSR
jgi:diadenylate cyclase